MGMFTMRKPRSYHHEYIYVDERKEKLQKNPNGWRSQSGARQFIQRASICLSYRQDCTVEALWVLPRLYERFWSVICICRFRILISRV